MSSSPLLSTAMLQFLVAYMAVVITPGPVALTTGSFASLHGFDRTIPLLAGVGVGTVLLVTLIALGATYLAVTFSMPMVKVVGAVVLGWMALRIARTVPLAAGEQPQKLQAGLFAGGFLISFLSPEAASFFAIAFMGLMLPIRDVSDALTVAAIVALFDASWHTLMAVALSRPAVRAAAMRNHRTICKAAASLLAFMALFSALSTFPID